MSFPELGVAFSSGNERTAWPCETPGLTYGVLPMWLFAARDIPALPTWMLNAAKGFAVLAPDGGVQVDGSAPALGATGKQGVHHIAVRALLAGPILGEERADLGLAARSLSATLRAGFGLSLRLGLGLATALDSRAA